MNELINIINTLIIDNSTNQVTPAKLRQVLIAMVTQMYASGGGGAVPAITAINPLRYDGFTATLDLLPIPFGEMRWLGNGYKWGLDPSSESGNISTTHPLPGDFFIGSDFGGNLLLSRWSGEGESKDPLNHIFGAKWRMRAPGETPEED